MQIMDLQTMLYHPSKVPALSFTLLFISPSTYCVFKMDGLRLGIFKISPAMICTMCALVYYIFPSPRMGPFMGGMGKLAYIQQPGHTMYVACTQFGCLRVKVVHMYYDMSYQASSSQIITYCYNVSIMFLVRKSLYTYSAAYMLLLGILQTPNFLEL